MTPSDEMTPDELQAMITRSSSGEAPVFAGEEAAGIHTSDRHIVHSGQFFEVEPDQLIDVGKHLATEGVSVQEAIKKAYALICEANLASRNIRHWNQQSRRRWVSRVIDEVVEEKTIREGSDKGKVPRLEVLLAFLDAKDRPSNKTDAGKLFNRWIREHLRMQDFKKAIPWNPTRPDFDESLNKKLCEKGWIRWFQDGSDGYLVLPEKTEQPAHKSRRKRKDGEHVTRPWWGTKTVWWPNPAAEEVKNVRKEFLVDGGKYFISDDSARQVLQKFERWLDLDEKMKRRKKASK